MILLCILIFALSGTPARAADPFRTDLGGFVHQIEFRPDSVRVTRIRQWVSPVQIHIPLAGGQLDLHSGAMYLEQTDTLKSEAWGALNTRLRGTWSLSRRALLTLHAAFPTGKRSLDAEDANLVRTLARNDLNFPVKTFGEGLDIGGALSLANQVGHTGWSLGVGYLRKGAYDPVDGVTGYKPGDAFSVSAGIDRTYKHWVYRLSALGTFYFTDRQNSQVVFRQGKQILFQMGLLYEGQRLQLNFQVTELLRLKNQELIPPEGLFLFETRDSNGNDLRGSLEISWTPYLPLTLFGSGHFKYLTANAHPSTSPLYQGDAHLWQTGGGIKIHLGPRYRLLLKTTRMKGKILDDTIDLSAFQFQGGLSRQF
ncbi:MAG: hypothetical protein O7G87_01680 [bacterium]|nr:hypothetical protein [bacterium]